MKYSGSAGKMPLANHAVPCVDNGDDGCSNDLGDGETEIIEYCAGSEVCVSCDSNYGFAGSGEGECVPDCDAAQDGSVNAGCRSSAPSYSHSLACEYCCSGSCYECNSGYHWDSNELDCVSDCSVSDCEVCDQSGCNSLDDGSSSNNGCWWDNGHCCPDLKVWEIDKCVESTEPCYPNLCPYDPGNPFDPATAAWWTTAACLDTNNNRACCYVEDYGGETYDYLPVTTY